MKHIMKVNDNAFERMRNGLKKREYRVNDSKRQQVRVGDIIEFHKVSHPEEKILMDVKSINSFKSLKDAMFLQLITNPHKYDKEHNCIIEHTDAISNFLNTEEGIKIRHKLVQDVADEYNLIYETNLN